ncbi:hypothetical protein MNV84_00246 [Leishmania braziliensis]|nr:hypothetical protein MNV84_00246 [Leishmania braziliensis]
MRRLQRYITVTTSSWRGRCTISGTPRLLCYFQGNSSECTPRCRHQRCLARAHEKTVEPSTIRSHPPQRGRRRHVLAEVYGRQASRAAAVDVDVTVTCSSLMSELQRLFPWSTSYCLWQERRRQTSAPSARSALSSAAAQEEDCTSSEPYTSGEGYDWRRLFLVRYEPHPALLSATLTTQRGGAERGCSGASAATAVGAARRGHRASQRCSRSSRQSRADICGTTLSTAAALLNSATPTAAVAGGTCESRALQLWQAVLLSSSSWCMEASSCPHNKSQVSGSSHTSPGDAAHAMVAGRQGCRTGPRTPAARMADSPTARYAGKGVRTKRAAVPSNMPSEFPAPPLLAWTAPPSYELYYLSGDVDRPRRRAASSGQLDSAPTTGATRPPLEHRPQRSDIVRRLRRVGCLHAIPGLPQLPPMLLSREDATPSAEARDGSLLVCAESTHPRTKCVAQEGADETNTLQVAAAADKAHDIRDDGDTFVEEGDVLGGTVCSLHDYCLYLTGSGHLEEDEAVNGADKAAYRSPSHTGQPATDSPASSGRGARVFERACERVGGTTGVSHVAPVDAAAAASSPSSPSPTINAAAPAAMCFFASPLSRGAEQAGRGTRSTTFAERWGVLGDDEGGTEDFSGLYGHQQQQQLDRKQAGATAGIHPRRLYEDVGHHHWNRISCRAFVDEMVRVRHRSHEPSSVTAALSAHPSAPPQRASIAAPAPRRQQQAAHNRHERTASTSGGAVLPFSSTPCAAPSLWVSDLPEMGCSVAALSASHGVGVLLAHPHEWIYFSVLFHVHAAQLPSACAHSAARLASHRSLDLSHLYCFLDPPCRLSTEELEEWARATRERRSERERARGRCHNHRRAGHSRGEEEEGGKHIRRAPPSSPPAYCAAAQTHPHASRLSCGTTTSCRATAVASEPSSPSAALAAAPSMAGPRTWLVYVHPDVSLRTLPRLWACAVGEAASGSGSEAGVGVGEHEDALPSYFHSALARTQRRQAAEVEMVCRYLLPRTSLRRGPSPALLARQAQASVGARARRSRGCLAPAAPAKATTAVAFPTPSTETLVTPDAAAQRRSTSAAALPLEDDEHRQRQLQALACGFAVSPLPRSIDLLKRRHWLTKPFVLVEEMKYGRVIKYGPTELAAPRVL